jgi:hypothetical protein
MKGHTTMKKLIAILTLAAVTFSASAQFVSGPAPQTALTVSTAFYVPGETTTNIPAALAPPFRAGRDGVGLYVLASGTNAATSTNATVILQALAGPSARVVDNQTYTFSFGTASGYDFYTNLASSLPNMLNIPQLQVKSIQNTNTLGIWITNITAYTR